MIHTIDQLKDFVYIAGVAIPAASDAIYLDHIKCASEIIAILDKYQTIEREKE